MMERRPLSSDQVFGEIADGGRYQKRIDDDPTVLESSSGLAITVRWDDQSRQGEGWYRNDRQSVTDECGGSRFVGL
jgi:hypothetical protein